MACTVHAFHTVTVSTADVLQRAKSTGICCSATVHFRTSCSNRLLRTLCPIKCPVVSDRLKQPGKHGSKHVTCNSQAQQLLQPAAIISAASSRNDHVDTVTQLSSQPQIPPNNATMIEDSVTCSLSWLAKYQSNPVGADQHAPALNGSQNLEELDPRVVHQPQPDSSLPVLPASIQAQSPTTQEFAVSGRTDNLATIPTAPEPHATHGNIPSAAVSLRLSPDYGPGTGEARTVVENPIHDPPFMRHPAFNPRVRAALERFASEGQRDVVLDPAQYVLVNGCAGSRKTDTLVRCVLRELLLGRRVLVLTLVGSVTSEICGRLEALLERQPVKQGASHHSWDFGEYGSIEVANYDGMVHKQLAVQRDPIVLYGGDCHQRKTRRLLNEHIQPGAHAAFHLASDHVADTLVLDELQDLMPTQLELLTGILFNHAHMRAIGVGDYLQTIFGPGPNPDGMQLAMDIWRTKLPGIRFHALNICFRCPDAHVGLANVLMRPWQQRFGLRPMLATGVDRSHVPVLFGHPATSGKKMNQLSHMVAKQVRAALVELKRDDPSLAPGDIAVIMPKVNDNMVFSQLQGELQRLFAAWGHPNDAVRLFRTRMEDGRSSIDWSDADGRAVLLSVHGDKGKGHKVVFVLGCTEGAVPNRARVFRPEELLDASLLNVAITRSTRWLFIGCAKNFPSRYLRDAQPELAQHVVLAWEPSTSASRAPVYVRLCQALCFPDGPHQELPLHEQPYFGNPHYAERQLVTPPRQVLSVSSGVESFEHANDLVPFRDWPEAKVTKFGRPPKQPYRMPRDQHALFGVMGELLFRRHHDMQKCCMADLERKLSVLTHPSRMFPTASEELLNAAQDIQFNHQVLYGTKPWDELLASLSSQWRQPPPVVQSCLGQLAARKPCLLVPYALWNHQPLARHVRRFLDQVVATRDLEAQCAWDVSLAEQILYGPERQPGCYVQLGAFDQDITHLTENVEALYRLVRHLQLQFGVRYDCTVVECSRHVLDEMGLTDKDRTVVGLRGVSDFETDNAVYEIKCPVSAKHRWSPNNLWALQPLLYHCLEPRHGSQDLHAVDLVNGRMYSHCGLDGVDRGRVLWKVLERAQQRLDHTKRLVANGLQGARV